MAKPLSSVSNAFTLSRGLFAAGDRLALVPTLSVGQGALVDTVTGARHALHEQAQPALELLADGIQAGEWIATLAKQNADPQRIGQIIDFINAIGGFQIHRPPLRHLPHLTHRTAATLLGIRPTTRGRRYPASLAGFFRATGRALLPVLLAVPVVAFAWTGAGFDHVATIATTGAIALWLSVALHEYAHTWPLLDRPRVIFQRGLRLGILHRRGRTRHELLSALAGPFIGAVVALLVAPNLAGLFLGLVHLSSLLPVHSDGRALYTNLRAARA